MLPDKSRIKLGKELFESTDLLFRPTNEEQMSISDLIVESLARCDSDIIKDVQESICLVGGTTLTKGFEQRLKSEVQRSLTGSSFFANAERQYSNWIGGSIISSLNNFNFMWVSKKDYDDYGDALQAVDTKCF